MLKINILTIATVIILFAITSCSESFLDRTPTDTLINESFFSSPEDLRSSTAPLYTQVWFEFNLASIFAIGDSKAGNVFAHNNYGPFLKFDVTASNNNMQEAWSSLYKVIAQSNHVIENAQKRATGVTQEQINHAIAEARFMRATAYFYLVRIWGPVIIYENQIKLISSHQLAPNTIADVYDFIIQDYLFAVSNLPPVDDPGRVTSWSAKGMLAKTYHSRSGLNGDGNRNEQDLGQAKIYAEDVIKNSPYKLMDNYKDLFLLANNNNNESMFAIQWFPSNTWGAKNTHQAYIAPESKLTRVGDGWGAGVHPSLDLIETFLKDPKDIVRREASIMLDGTYYPELLKNDGGYTYRGEKGAWKKYVIGTPDDNNGAVSFMNAPINTYMLRLSEIYLLYADAIRGNNQKTTDPEALLYFNKVRERANVDPILEISQKDILREVRLEFAGEGVFWYYLVNWFYYEPNQALEYINNQKRSYNFKYSATKIQWASAPATPIEATLKDFYMPYPESEVVQNPNLLNQPVKYMSN